MAARPLICSITIYVSQPGLIAERWLLRWECRRGRCIWQGAHLCGLRVFTSDDIISTVQCGLYESKNSRPGVKFEFIAHLQDI